jgi:HAD superfamily hydrolase (TIGR01459 family)
MADTTGEQGETTIISALEEISAGYDVLLCDLWGCYHNGIEPYPAAVAALQRFRARGGTVVLLTNAPRAGEFVAEHLARMGAPRDSWDAIVSSGDATRAALGSGRYGDRIHVIGPDRDNALYEGVGVTRVAMEEATAILCSGLVDDRTETPDDYADQIARGVALGLPMLCANPDLIVDRGEERLYCAGAIADAYARAGGEAQFFGKPHAPIYDLALETARRLRGAETPLTRILATGDGVGTDVPGASDLGVDCLFVSGGLAAQDVGDDPEKPDPARLAQYLVEHGASPRYTIGRMR